MSATPTTGSRHVPRTAAITNSTPTTTAIPARIPLAGMLALTSA